MKHVHLPTQKFFLFLLAGALSSPWLRAQNSEPEKRSEDGTIHIRIEREKDGKKHVYEHTYQDDGSTNSPGSSFWFSDSLAKGLGTGPDSEMFRQQLENLFRHSPDDSLKNENRLLPFNPTDLQSLLEPDVMKQFRFRLDTAGDRFSQLQFRLDTLHENLPGDLFQNLESRTNPFGKFPFGADRVELDGKDYQVQELKNGRGKKYIITRRKRSK